MLRIGDTLRGDDRGAVSDPAPFPLLPDDGDSFLDGSIQPQEYLAEKRAQERQKAMDEIDDARISRSMSISLITAVVTVIVSLANLVITLSAIFKNYFEIAAGGATIVVLGTAIALRQFIQLQRLR